MSAHSSSLWSTLQHSDLCAEARTPFLQSRWPSVCVHKHKTSAVAEHSIECTSTAALQAQDTLSSGIDTSVPDRKMHALF